MKRTVRVLSLLMALMTVLGMLSLFCFTAGAEGTTAAETPSVNLYSGTLVYENEIKIRYRVKVTGVSAEEVKVYAWNTKEAMEAGDTTTAVELATEVKDGDVYASTKGIAAKDLTDMQYVKAFAGDLKSVGIEYSPMVYAQNIFNNAASSKTQKDAVVALANYCAAAQVKFDNATENLANSWVPQDYALTDWEGWKSAADVNITGESNGFTPYSGNMLFNGEISFLFKYTVDTTVTGTDVSLEYSNEAGEVLGTVPMTAEGDKYVATVPAPAVKDLDKAYTLKPFYVNAEGAKVYGPSFSYSAMTYVMRVDKDTEHADDVDFQNGVALAKTMANLHHYVKDAVAEIASGTPIAKTYTASVTFADLANSKLTDTPWINGNKYPTYKMDENVTVLPVGWNNTGRFYVSDNTWRVYSSEGGHLDFSVAPDYELVSITVNYKEGTVSVGSKDEDEIVPTTPGTVEIDCTGLDTVSVYAKTGKLKITSIVVVYKDKTV